MKIVFTYDYGKNNFDKIRALGYDVSYINEHEITNDIIPHDTQILVCYNPFERLDIDKLPNLKFILLSSIGIDQIPVQKVLKNKIIVCNNRGGYSKPMAEWIVFKILESYKHGIYFYKHQQLKKWSMNTKLEEITDKTVCFLGTGTIASESAKRLQNFECKIIGVNTRGSNKKYFDKCYSSDNIKDAVKKSDIVVVALPYTEATHHIVNAELLNKMKANAVLINIARGAIVDEKALIRCLENQKFKTVALDVFEKEPLPEQSPLWDFENVHLSFHNSWISQKRNERRFDMIYQNLKRYADGKEFMNQVNVERGY